MGTTLTGTTPQDTYDSLIKVTDNGPLSGTAKYLSDGLGNDSTLALSTGNIGIATTSLNSRLTVQGGDGITIRNAGDTFIQCIDTSNAGVNYLEFKGSGGATGSISYSQATNFMAFRANGAERMRITSAGNVGIGTSSPTSLISGTERVLQISNSNIASLYLTSTGTGTVAALVDSARNFSIFDATAGVTRAAFTANGLCFNNDTAAANALDDYEEGTFTPTTAGDPTGAFSSATGEYTKIGNVVHFRIAAGVSANFSDNFIGGLPYTVGGSGSTSGLMGGIEIVNDNTANLSALITVGTTSVRTYSDNNINNQAPPTTTMGTLRMFGTYRV